MDRAPIILGTAGHIDHGKSSLVRALTGIDPDRLAEEQARGITIELGFAHLDAGGLRFGFVDVPGHERFVRAMVAGATGVDVCVLVVAADEGVMPQTREHVAIGDLLGLRAGVVALTKCDLVNDELRELAIADVRAALEGTFLADAPIVPVSVRAQTGLDALTAAILSAARALRPRSADGPLRVPVDRVFTLKGFGTVVTGTVAGGRVSVGDEIALLPGGPAGKVRGLHVHGDAVPAARAGQRVAANLTVPRDGLDRGLMLVAARDGLAPTHLLDVRVRLLDGDHPAVRRRTRLLFHHGTAQLGATLVLAEAAELAPGATALAQLRLERPVVALPGDRFILRGFARAARSGTTIGGGEVVRALAPKLRPSRPDSVASLRAVARAEGAARAALEVRGLGPAGLDDAALAARLGWPLVDTRALVRKLVADGALWQDGAHLVDAEVVATLEADALAALTTAAAEIPREELRSRLPRAVTPRLFDAIAQALVRRGKLTVDRDRVALARPSTAATPAATPLATTLAARFATWALEPPRPAELAAAVGEPAPAIASAVDALLRAGTLVRVRVDYVVDRAALDALRARLVAHLRAHGQITPQEWKTLVGASRKFSIPLAEHFDGEKLTLRVGDVRRPRNLPPA